MSHGSVLAPKVGSKWVPNRIIDVGGVRKALGTHLSRYHSALGAILGALDGYKIAQRADKELQPFNSGAAKACGEGGGEDKPLPGTGDRRFRFKENCSNHLHALRLRGLGGLSPFL